MRTALSLAGDVLLIVFLAVSFAFSVCTVLDGPPQPASTVAAPTSASGPSTVDVMPAIELVNAPITVRAPSQPYAQRPASDGLLWAALAGHHSHQATHVASPAADFAFCGLRLVHVKGWQFVPGPFGPVIWGTDRFELTLPWKVQLTQSQQDHWVARVRQQLRQHPSWRARAELPVVVASL